MAAQQPQKVCPEPGKCLQHFLETRLRRTQHEMIYDMNCGHGHGMVEFTAVPVVGIECADHAAKLIRSGVRAILLDQDKSQAQMRFVAEQFRGKAQIGKGRCEGSIRILGMVHGGMAWVNGNLANSYHSCIDQ